MKKIFAITVNYNKDDSTKRLLKTLEDVKKTGFELHIIVVDNGTKKEFVLDKKHQNITVFRPGVNTGFAGGSNIGIKMAIDMGADYILLTNNDTMVDKGLVGNLFEVLQKNGSVGIVTPKIYFEKGKEFHKEKYKKDEFGRVLWFAGGYIDWENAKSVHRGVDEVDNGQYEKTESVDFATGCCMMIKKEVLETVGLFDERYFLYYEDADLSVRVKKAGYEIYYVPDAFLYHENASSSGSGSPLHDYFLTRNQMLFGMRYASTRTKASLLRQCIRILFKGREYQKRGVRDYFLGKFGMGTYFIK